MVLHMDTHPIDAAVEAIDQIMLRLNAVDIPQDQGGRRTSTWRGAVRRLLEFVDRDNPALTRAQREDLCHHLFDTVRERHGHRSRARNRDEDEVPKYTDLLKSIEAEQAGLGKPDTNWPSFP
jgi:hypothetical protein